MVFKHFENHGIYKTEIIVKEKRFWRNIKFDACVVEY